MKMFGDLPLRMLSSENRFVNVFNSPNFRNRFYPGHRGVVSEQSQSQLNVYVVSSFWARVEIKTFAPVIVICRVGYECFSIVKITWEQMSQGSAVNISPFEMIKEQAVKQMFLTLSYWVKNYIKNFRQINEYNTGCFRPRQTKKETKSDKTFHSGS